MNEGQIVVASVLDLVQTGYFIEDPSYSVSATVTNDDVLVQIARGSNRVTLRAPLEPPADQGPWDASSWGHLLGSLIVETIDTQQGHFPTPADFEWMSDGLWREDEQ